ncbi:hypothetical protein [Longimicrobium sp.]|uniref:hypothetical protein n=1 Tax=Longimicrobium sp. TaxID=2029185 RepID=UPI002E2F9507|nr:hypothetical protein [Longimicrobium sp.]HEX6036990.1 hypothetical protein [Longimicrobium sp.]
MYSLRVLAVRSALLALFTDGVAVAQTPTRSDPLLTYAVSPSPDPLEVSRPGTLRVVVSHTGPDPVRVRSLLFSVAVGTPDQPEAAALINTDDRVGLDAPAGWEFTSLGEGSFRAAPRPPSTTLEITGQGLVFTLSNLPVNSVAGTTTLLITEQAESGSQAMDRRQVVLPLSKFPERFRAGDLTASRTRVGFRDTVTLRWEGSDAAYSILYGKDTVSIGPRTRAWTTPPLEQSTTFTLVARAQEGGSTVEHRFPITVQVSNPAVLAHDLAVQGPSVLQGPVQAGADLRVGTDVRASGRVYDAGGVVFPSRGIVMWAGSADQLPQGWVLCDGRNGTPDLRGRFVVGWKPGETDYDSIGETGGAPRVALGLAQMPAHAHAGATGQAGSHSHVSEGSSASGLASRRRLYPGQTTIDMYWGGGSDADPGDVQWRGTVETNSSGNHSHPFTTSPAGGGEAHENRPPYYVLAYIMKL